MQRKRVKPRVLSRRMLMMVAAIVQICFGLTTCAANDVGSQADDDVKKNWKRLTQSLVKLIEANPDQPIIVIFGAKWDLVSQLCETTLQSPEVTEELKELGVAMILADVTKEDTIGAKEMRSFALAPPLNLLYSPKQKRWIELPKSIHRTNLAQVFRIVRENVVAR